MLFNATYLKDKETQLFCISVHSAGTLFLLHQPEYRGVSDNVTIFPHPHAARLCTSFGSGVLWCRRCNATHTRTHAPSHHPATSTQLGHSVPAITSVSSSEEDVPKAVPLCEYAHLGAPSQPAAVASVWADLRRCEQQNLRCAGLPPQPPVGPCGDVVLLRTAEGTVLHRLVGGAGRTCRAQQRTLYR